MPPPGAHALVPRGFPNPGWPLGGFPPPPGSGQPAGPPAGTLASADSFRILTTCSWEQSDTMVKVYVPLRGVQTDMLRATFTSNSVEVRPCNVMLPIVVPLERGEEPLICQNTICCGPLSARRACSRTYAWQMPMVGLVV